LNVFVQSEQLKCCDKAHAVYTYENVAASTEIILLFLKTFQKIIDYRSLHDGNNLSDHVPILLTISLAAEHDESNNSRQSLKRVQWDKATADNIAPFRHMLGKFCAQLKLKFDAYIAKIHRVRYIVMH